MANFEMPRKLKTLFGGIREDKGQALVEYALLISLIAVVCFAAVGTFGLKVAGLYSHVVQVYP